MFFLYDLERTITLHPSFFGPRVNEYLKNRLMEDVEGTCTGQYYIICVMDAHDISEGRVVPGSAVAEYTVHYRAVVWRPFKGETVGLAKQHSKESSAKFLTYNAGRCNCKLGKQNGSLRRRWASSSLCLKSCTPSLPTSFASWLISAS